MQILEMIAEFRKGCSCAGPLFDEMMKNPVGTTPPEDCHKCAIGLIDAIEKHLHKKVFDGCIVPNFAAVLDRLTKISDLRNPANRGQGGNAYVRREDLRALVSEFHRVDATMRRFAGALIPQPISDEDHRVT